ncbi:hypothetical protein BDW22DRAFT_923797 [Trametopsis cervina]|nr:hypothetical protein BDW22DRAFT_923797 [Trametopsis cervina]
MLLDAMLNHHLRWRPPTWCTTLLVPPLSTTSRAYVPTQPLRGHCLYESHALRHSRMDAHARIFKTISPRPSNPAYRPATCILSRLFSIAVSALHVSTSVPGCRPAAGHEVARGTKPY